MYIPVTPAFRKRQNCKFNATMYENRWKTLQCALSAYDIGTSVHNPFQHVKALDHVEEAPQKVNVASVYGTEKTWIVKTRQKQQQQQKTPKGIVLKMHFPLKQINSEWGSRSCWGLDFQEAGGESWPLLRWSCGGRQLLSPLLLLLPELSSLFQPPGAHLPPAPLHPPTPELELLLKPKLFLAWENSQATEMSMVKTVEEVSLGFCVLLGIKPWVLYIQASVFTLSHTPSQRE